MKKTLDQKLFHKDISFTETLCCLPTELEKNLLKGVITNEEIIVRWYKALVLPLQFGNLVVSNLIEYFLSNSTFESENKSKFIFKLISL